MLGPTTPGDTTLIYPYVRSVRTEEDRESPISTMTVVLPPYPAEKISRIRVGMTIRWEAGYWEDGIRPLNKRGEGYHEEFEGVITSVARKNYYEGHDIDAMMRRGKRRSPLSIVIEAMDYMYLYNQTSLKPTLQAEPAMETTALLEQVLSTDGRNAEHGLQLRQLYNPTNVNPSGAVGISASTPAQVFAKFRNTSFPVDKVLAVDSYFRGKKLLIRDPNDTMFADQTETGGRQYPTFVEGDNVIEADLSPRAAEFIQVEARWYNQETGQYVTETYPKPGMRAYEDAKIAFSGTDPRTMTFDINGDGSDQPPNLLKEAENIYARIAGDGLVGSFSTFGYPPVHRGDLIIYAGTDPERQKAVIIDRVVKEYDAEHAKFRQEISPGFTPTLIINPEVGSRDAATINQIRTEQARKKAELQATVKQIIQSVRSAGG